MKELDLMYALEGVDDDILRDAERFELRPRRRLLPRAAAIAAVIALLCGTVYAAVMSVKVNVTGKTWLHHNEALREDVVYTDIEVEYELTQQEIPAQSMDFLEDYLDVHWQASVEKRPIGDEAFVGMVSRGGCYLAGRHWWYDENDELRRPESVQSHYFQSVEEAEDFFGMRFALPACVRTTALRPWSEADSSGILLEVLTPPLASVDQIGPYLEDLSEEAAAEQIVPGYAELSFRVVDPTAELDGISGSIIIALNDDAANGGYTRQTSVALDYLGKPTFPELNIDGLDGSLVVFPPCDTDPGAVHAYYTCDGVGYVLYAYVREGVETEDPAQLLLPWLEQLG